MRRSSAKKRGFPRHDEDPESGVRLAKVGSTIRKAIQGALSRGLGDPRIRGLVSITEVDVSPDLSAALIRISVLPEQYESTVLRGLASAKGRFQREVQQATRLRRIPRIRFEIDKSLKKQARIESLLHGENAQPVVDNMEATDT
ncbi:MAG: ribosome-binding factor A [Planctomycetes bacterium TMED75]|nr:ribosome-binding factor A [Planctomycetaceae bacterium]OUU92002.1 MAG: ribosome-binding factor A [Planctomycetes bacterium TMED75]